VKLLPKATISTAKSNRPIMPQQSSSLDRPSISRPLSRGALNGGPSPTSNHHVANFDKVQLATSDDNTPPAHRSPATRVPPSTTLAGSAVQHIGRQFRPYAFRSGSLAIKSITSIAPPTMQATNRDASHLALPNSPTRQSSQPNKVELRETWIDDSDSDAPLSSAVVSRITQHLTGSANFKRREGGVALASSNSTRSLDHSWSSSASGMQPNPTASVESMRVSLDRHDKSRRILQLSKGSLIHATMHGFINQVDLSPLRLQQISCALKRLG
jgi:hypothetical protein